MRAMLLPRPLLPSQPHAPSQASSRPWRGYPVSSPFSSPHSYQHPQPLGHVQWGRRHSEPLVTQPGPLLGLTRRGSEPTYLPSVAVGWSRAEAKTKAVWGTEIGLEGLASQNEELGVSSWKLLLTSCESSGAQQWAQWDLGWGSSLSRSQAYTSFHPSPSSRFPARGKSTSHTPPLLSVF